MYANALRRYMQTLNEDIPSNELMRLYTPPAGGFIRREDTGETQYVNGQPGGIYDRPTDFTTPEDGGGPPPMRQPMQQQPMQQAQPARGGQVMRVLGYGNGQVTELSPERGDVSIDYSRPMAEIPGVGKGYYSKDGRSAYVKTADGVPTKVLLGYDAEGSMRLNALDVARREKEAQIAQSQAATEHSQEETRASKVNNPDWMGTQGAVGALPGTPGADMSGVPDGVRAQAQAVAQGDAPLPSTRSGKMSPIAVLAYQINPNLKATDYIQKQQTIQDFSSKGKSGQVVQSINQALHHASGLSDAIDALDNTDTLPGVLNPIKNKVGPLINGTYTAPGDYVTYATALSEELKKIYAGGGGGNVTEFNAWQKSFNPNAGITQQKSYLADGMKLLQGAIDSRKQAYERGMGPTADFGTLLDAHAQTALKKLSGLGGASPAQAQPSGRIALDAPPLASQYPGKIMTSPDGMRYKSDGKNWVRL